MRKTFNENEIKLLNQSRCPECGKKLSPRKLGLICDNWKLNKFACKNYHSGNGPYFYQLDNKWVKTEHREVTLQKEE
jgi:hypothetical protein